MKVLIVEDDVTLSKSVQLLFKRRDISFDAAETGAEALDLLDIYSYDLVLLDVLLPDMSGLDILKSMRSQKIATPVLILSGLGDTANKTGGLDLGADDYLSKPFDKDELIARINAVIRRSQGYAQSTIEVDDQLHVHLESKQVKIDGKHLPLTKKEYEIFETLALRKKKHVSKDTLLDYLYGGSDNEPDQKIIDVYICKIRKKIEQMTKKNYIATVWGQGYMLTDE